MILSGLIRQLQKETADNSPRIWRDGKGKLVIRASAVGDCPRSLWYELQGAPVEPCHIDVVMARHEGHEYEKRVFALLKKAGYDIRHRGKVLTKALDGVTIKGHIDAMLYVADSPYAIIDAKRQRIGPNKEIAQKHNPQMQAYMYASGLSLAILIANLKASRYEAYRSAEAQNVTSHLREIKIVANKASLASAIASVKTAEREQAPDRIPVVEKKGFSVHDFRCMYCRYSSTCLPNARIVKINNSPKLVD